MWFEVIVYSLISFALSLFIGFVLARGSNRDIISIKDLLLFVDEYNWLKYSFQGTFEDQDFAFLDQIEFKTTKSENGCTVRISNTKSINVSYNIKYATLNILDSNNEIERHFTFNLQKANFNYGLHIKTDHDYIEYLTVFQNIINKTKFIYNKYKKVVV